MELGSSVAAIADSARLVPPMSLDRTSAVDIVGDEAADLGPENEVDLFMACLFTLEGWLMEYVLLGIFLAVGIGNFVSLIIRPIDTPFDCLSECHNVRLFHSSTPRTVNLHQGSVVQGSCLDVS
jgi:hypothetical protein